MRRSIATTIAALVAAAGLALVVQRGGLLAWAGSMLAVALLLKVCIRPSNRDIVLTVAAALSWALAWVGTNFYVASTWESGEVVELGIQTPNGPHTARVWVLDAEETPELIYDAKPEIAAALMRGDPVRLKRQGHVSLERPVARPIEDVPEGEVNTIFQLMDEEYGDRNLATDVFYRFIGRERDRVVMIVMLEE